jgi:endonuclease I
MLDCRFNRMFLVSSLWLVSVILSAQPAGYYTNAEGKTGTVLQQELHNIIHNHTVVTYDALWTHFQNTDKKSDGTVWDMYSDKPGLTPAYVFTFVQNQCGNYTKEGDCYNREHSFPKSWFSYYNDDPRPMYSDLNHLVPTDGKVNGMRGNYPFGVTTSPTWTSTNGSKVGTSSYMGYTGIIFEPINAYKGDFARIILYMAVRYFGEDAGWAGSDMVTGSQPKSWAINMLLEWNINDPVSQKEKDRNDSVYLIQGNRNPFIDNSDYANQIWGTQSSSDVNISEKETMKIYPNPAEDMITIEPGENISTDILLTITDISGRIVLRKVYNEIPLKVDLKGLSDGLYLVSAESDGKIFRSKIVISR